MKNTILAMAVTMSLLSVVSGREFIDKNYLYTNCASMIHALKPNSQTLALMRIVINDLCSRNINTRK